MHVVTFRLNFHNLWRNFNGYSLARYESGITTLLGFSLSFFELDKFDGKKAKTKLTAAVPCMYLSLVLVHFNARRLQRYTSNAEISTLRPFALTQRTTAHEVNIGHRS